MASIYDVASYILEKQGPLSTMKLQKLCYYAQAWSLVWDDEALFNEEFEAWVNGPVCRPLYEKTRGLFKIKKLEDGDSSVLTNTQKETIKQVLEHYGEKDAQWLSRLTHMEEPWKEARTTLREDERGTAVITQASMAEYYGGL